MTSTRMLPLARCSSRSRLVVVLLEHVRLSEVSAALELAAAANESVSATGTRPRLESRLVARSAGPVMTTCGAALVASESCASFVPVHGDTLLVVGELEDQDVTGVAFAQLMRLAATRGCRIVCCGNAAPVLRAVGLRLMPGSAAHDAVQATLAVLREKFGPAVVEAARRQAPPSGTLTPDRASPDAASPMQVVAEWIRQDPSRDFSLQMLADHVAVSRRTLTRRFAREHGLTPVQFIEQTRVTLAREMLETEPLAGARIAARVGFVTEERMRRAFHRVLGASPSAFRVRPETQPPSRLIPGDHHAN